MHGRREFWKQGTSSELNSPVIVGGPIGCNGKSVQGKHPPDQAEPAVSADHKYIESRADFADNGKHNVNADQENVSIRAEYADAWKKGQVACIHSEVMVFWHESGNTNPVPCTF